MYMDRTTEAIAHFIGLFELTVDQAWQRQAYDAFAAEDPSPPDPDTLPNIETTFSAAYELGDYKPGLVYRATAYDLTHYTESHLSFLRFEPPEIRWASVTPSDYVAYPRFIATSGMLSSHGANYRIVQGEPEAETLGSIANYIRQGIRLSDNDYFSVGAHGLRFTPQPVDDSQIVSLFNAASELTPIAGNAVPGSADALTAFAHNLRETLDGFAPKASDGQTVFVDKQATIEGTFVNGRKVDEALELDSYFSFEERLESGPHSDEPLAPNAKLTDAGWDIDASVKVETGGNVLVNNTVVKNLWTASPVTAVVGDHVEINAIIQINAWSDNDAVTSAIADWDENPVGTQAFNVATFERFDTSSDEGSDAASSFPDHWVIKEVKGDFIIVNWQQQLTFMSDNDFGILSSSGVTTAVYSGHNIAYNDISIYELGFAYDLIIVGGNYYDVNIIQQLNILLDDDLIGAANGFETTGDGTYSTSDNLLWNKAHIYNVGGADRFEALPGHYKAAANALAAGEDFLNDGVLSDPAFAGQGALRVLHITGDLINVQYTKMTNILGDSDQVALAMDAVGAHPEADWSVTTGGNALINNAAILDLDSLGKTYVGGGQYSNDILIQANIISTEPEFGAQNPDVLVNEAIAFLDEEVPQRGDEKHGSSGDLDPDNAHGDALQTMIG